MVKETGKICLSWHGRWPPRCITGEKYKPERKSEAGLCIRLHSLNTHLCWRKPAVCVPQASKPAVCVPQASITVITTESMHIYHTALSGGCSTINSGSLVSTIGYSVSIGCSLGKLDIKTLVEGRNRKRPEMPQCAQAYACNRASWVNAFPTLSPPFLTRHPPI